MQTMVNSTMQRAFENQCITEYQEKVLLMSAKYDRQYITKAF